MPEPPQCHKHTALGHPAFQRRRMLNFDAKQHANPANNSLLQGLWGLRCLNSRKVCDQQFAKRPTTRLGVTSASSHASAPTSARICGRTLEMQSVAAGGLQLWHELSTTDPRIARPGYPLQKKRPLGKPIWFPQLERSCTGSCLDTVKFVQTEQGLKDSRHPTSVYPLTINYATLTGLQPEAGIPAHTCARPAMRRIRSCTRATQAPSLLSGWNCLTLQHLHITISKSFAASMRGSTSCLGVLHEDSLARLRVRQSEVEQLANWQGKNSGAHSA